VRNWRGGWGGRGGGAPRAAARLGLPGAPPAPPDPPGGGAAGGVVVPPWWLPTGAAEGDEDEAGSGAYSPLLVDLWRLGLALRNRLAPPLVLAAGLALAPARLALGALSPGGAPAGPRPLLGPWPAPDPVPVPPNPARLMDVLLRASALAVLGRGCFSADPHGGNFLLMPDGRVAAVDFGQAGGRG